MKRLRHLLQEGLLLLPLGCGADLYLLSQEVNQVQAPGDITGEALPVPDLDLVALDAHVPWRPVAVPAAHYEFDRTALALQAVHHLAYPDPERLVENSVGALYGQDPEATALQGLNPCTLRCCDLGHGREGRRHDRPAPCVLTGREGRKDKHLEASEPCRRQDVREIDDAQPECRKQFKVHRLQPDETSCEGVGTHLDERHDRAVHPEHLQNWLAVGARRAQQHTD